MSILDLFVSVDTFWQGFKPLWERELMTAGRQGRRATVWSVASLASSSAIAATSPRRSPSISSPPEASCSSPSCAGNMRERVLAFTEKLLLRKRAIIESVNDQLKNICQIEHSRHRSPYNFLAHLLAGLIACCHQPKELSLHSDRGLHLLRAG